MPDDDDDADDDEAKVFQLPVGLCVSISLSLRLRHRHSNICISNENLVLDRLAPTFIVWLVALFPRLSVFSWLRGFDYVFLWSAQWTPGRKKE